MKVGAPSVIILANVFHVYMPILSKQFLTHSDKSSPACVVSFRRSISNNSSVRLNCSSVTLIKIRNYLWSGGPHAARGPQAAHPWSRACQQSLNSTIVAWQTGKIENRHKRCRKDTMSEIQYRPSDTKQSVIIVERRSIGYSIDFRHKIFKALFIFMHACVSVWRLWIY